MDKLIGICNYCGQACSVPMAEYSSEEEKNEAATRICLCENARRERMIQSGYNKIVEIFSTECIDIGLKAASDEQIEVIKMAAEAVCNDTFLSVTICLRNGIKAVLKGNSKGELEIQRTDTTAMKKLADDK